MISSSGLLASTVLSWALIRRRLAHSNPVRALRSRRLSRRAKIRVAEETVRIPEREVVGRLL